MGVSIQQAGDRIFTLGDLAAMQVYSGKVSGAANWWEAGGATGIWAAYQPKGAASLAAAYVDQSGNGNNAGVGVAPTWNSTDGWIFNGSTQYLTTTFTPQNDQSQTMIVQFTNATAGLTLCGMNQTNNCRFYLSANHASARRYANGNRSSVAPAVTAGNLCVAGNQGYLNGAAEGAAIGAYVGIPIWPVYIGLLNATGTPQWGAPSYMQAYALYDIALTAPQVLAVATAMGAL